MKYNPRSLMHPDESFTNEGLALQHKVEAALQPIIDEFTGENFSVRDICHIVTQTMSYTANRVLLQRRRRAETLKEVPTFETIREFLVMWGLGLNDGDVFFSVTTPTIPYPIVYNKMLEAATDVGGLIMSKYITTITHTDGNKAYLLPSRSWDRIEGDWNTYREENANLAQ